MINKIVYYNKANGQKLVTIPKWSAIEPGDVVKIVKIGKIKEEEKKQKEK